MQRPWYPLIVLHRQTKPRGYWDNIHASIERQCSHRPELMPNPLDYYLAPGGGCEVLFSPCLSVCVCVCVCMSGQYLVFYFSVIRRDIDLKFIQGAYRVVLNSRKNMDLHRVKVKVTGTVHWFLKVQSYHKNWAIEKFQYFFIDTS